MKGFLKFAGVIEFVLYVVGIFLMAFNIPLAGINIFYFCLYLLLGSVPAFVLFAIAQILENTEVNESEIDKLNRKLDRLLGLPDAETNESEDEPQENKIVFKTIGQLDKDEKKKYKNQIYSEFLQFPFQKYASAVKKKMEGMRDEALESIDTANTSVEAEKIVQAFKDALKDLE